jgi:hypothetical protein
MGEDIAVRISEKISEALCVYLAIPGRLSPPASSYGRRRSELRRLQMASVADWGQDRGGGFSRLWTYGPLGHYLWRALQLVVSWRLDLRAYLVRDSHLLLESILRVERGVHVLVGFCADS